MSITSSEIHTKRESVTAPNTFFELEDILLEGYRYKAYMHAPKTVIDVIQSGRNHGDLEFLVFEDTRLSFSRYFEQVDALAASMKHDFSIVKGDRVAIAMPNNPEWMVTYAAATLLGAIVVPINSWGKTAELSYAIQDCRARLMMCDPARFSLVEDILPELAVDVLVVAGAGFESGQSYTLFDSAIESGRGRSYRVAEVTPEDACVILYTSGSTGFPKGVVHRHMAIGQSLMNMMWLGMLLVELEGVREYKGGAERETPLLTVPLFHATGLLAGYFMPLYLGQKAVIMHKWDSERALQIIQDEKVTSLSSVPAIVQDLLTHPSFDDYNTETLIRVAGAGAATPAGLPELIDKKVGAPSRSAGYAMTETLAVGSTMSGAIFDLKPEASGIVSPIMQLRFVDTDGTVLPQGEQGEVEFYGITCTPGYWEKPEANSTIFDDNRWMKSGDIGFIDDDGFVHITGRIKEIVIRGGENIYPGEIENIAYELDQVHEVVVFGEPDPAMGEELVMVVYLTPGSLLEEAALSEILRERLAAYKVPKTILFSDSPLPRNASEKLHKLRVRENYLTRVDGK